MREFKQIDPVVFAVLVLMIIWWAGDRDFALGGSLYLLVHTLTRARR